MHAADNPSSSKRRGRHRGLLMFVTILAGVLFGIGAQAGVFFQGDRSEPEHSAQGAGMDRSPSLVPTAFQGPSGAPDGSTTMSAEKTSSAASGPADGMVASRTHEPVGESRSEQAHKVVHKEPAEASSDPLNLLVLGVDKRPPDSNEAQVGGSRSDTIMLAQVTPATGRVELLSVPRDLLVEVEPGVEDRINTAYTYGGIDQARAVMEGVTGVHVDSYVIVDFEGFEKVIDAIGGVKVDVGHGVFPEKWHMGEGVQKLGGRKALFYARYRGTPRADLDRIEHQQLLLAALRKKALKWNTITKLPQIVRLAITNVDTNLGILQVISLARALVLHSEDGDMTAVQLQGTPTTLPSGAQVLVPNDDANQAILQEFHR